MNRDGTIDSGVQSLNDTELAEVVGGGPCGVIVNPFGCDVAPLPPQITPTDIAKTLASIINTVF